MARLEGNGVPYFPLVTVWDRKLKLIEAKYKLEGAGCIVALMQAIYGEGYAMVWDDEAELLFSSEKGIAIERLREIVDFAVTKEIFDQGMLREHHVLTSHGIQKQWLAIVKSAHRKATKIDPEVCLLTAAELGTDLVPRKVSDGSEKSGESAPTSAESTEDSPQSKVKESKEKGEREKERDGAASPSTPAAPTPVPQNDQPKKETPGEPGKEPLGKFKNIFLAPKNYQDLCRDYSQTAIDREIELLSVHIQSTHKLYADHYATLTKWLIQDKVPKRLPDYYETHPRDDFTPAGRHAFRDALRAAADKLPLGLRQGMTIP